MAGSAPLGDAGLAGCQALGEADDRGAGVTLGPAAGGYP
jgi:hypothetical protein